MPTINVGIILPITLLISVLSLYLFFYRDNRDLGLVASITVFLLLSIYMYLKTNYIISVILLLTAFFTALSHIYS